jgi:hypothetical protein
MATSRITEFFAKCCGRRPKNLESEYDPRFGAAEITAPNQGAYTSPLANSTIPPTVVAPKEFHKPPHLRHSQMYDLKDYNAKISPTDTRDKASPTFSQDTKFSSGSQPDSPFSTESSVPVHQAYIPTDKFAVRTVSVSSPQSSPPASPPLPTPTSVSRILQPAPSGLGEQMRFQDGTFSNVSNTKPQRGAQVRIEPNTERRMPGPNDWTPDSAYSVEQWPGRM